MAGSDYACDACRRRKIRCDRSNPCAGCTQAVLCCTFSATHRPKGRQGRTANIISELRVAQIHNIQGSVRRSEIIRAPPNGSLKNSRTVGLLSDDTLAACRDFFFSHFYSTAPMLQPEMLQVDDLMNISSDTYCLLVSFCAFIIIQTGAVHASSKEENRLSADMGYGRALIDEVFQARERRSPNEVVQSSTHAVVTAFLLYGSYRTLNDQNKAFYFLREATTLCLLGYSDEPENQNMLVSNQLYWLLLVTERAYALRKHCPLTILISSTSPDIDDLGIDAAGVRLLVALFRPFDETFLGLWNGTISRSQCSIAWLVKLDKDLQSVVSIAFELSDFQMADLLVTQQWLRMIVWQLSNTLGFLTSSTLAHESMTFRYPIQIARDLAMATWNLSQQSMEVHGIGLIEKLFDISFTLVDVMALIPSTANQESLPRSDLTPEDCLSYLLRQISNLRGGEDRFLPLLTQKIAQSLPMMTDPLTRQLHTPSLWGSSQSPSENRSPLSDIINDG